jgi:carbonic anhydrase/acetyltransferase-like protein (isoleucine patch superfamily)
MAILLPYLDTWPKLGRDVFLAPNATVTGDVELGDEVSVWFGAVIRGDSGPIRIGARTNIQDLVCVHATRGVSTTHIGAEVTVGHGAILHGCKVGDRCLIGMGAILLDNAEIAPDSLVAAGAVVSGKLLVPPRSLVAGNPAKVLRDLRDEEMALGPSGVAVYLENARIYSVICGGENEPGSHRGGS